MTQDAEYHRAYRLRRIAEMNPVKPNRTKTYARKPRPKVDRSGPRPNRHKDPSKWERRVIVAWDGEGANLSDGTHIYNLLANSHGDYIIEHEGLGTEQVFEFFLNNSFHRDINVIFGGSYDVNMILVDLPRENLTELWVDGRTVWKSYLIHWANRKKFTVHKMKGKRKVQSFVLWDVLGYFQMTFVNACRKWLGDIPILDEIQKMKEQRADFDVDKIEEIVEYNRRECQLLVLLCTALFDSLDQAEIKLMRYDGAGSIAAALLKKFHVKEHKGIIPPAVNSAAQYAYSGGRIEAVKTGNHIGKIERSDINSAYPSAAVDLPSYTGAQWTNVQGAWNGDRRSLVCVEWHIAKERPFYPLFYRDHSGAISYPRSGTGIYWGIEVENLVRYFEEGKDYRIVYSLNVIIKDDTKPFEFIRNLYIIRRAFADKGSMASESLKLGLNSIYGKLVQQAGWRKGASRIPTYHQLLWGGYITAATRSKLYEAAMQSPTKVIAFATDAIFTTAHVNLPSSKDLGDWTQDQFEGMTIVQAGVYWLKQGDIWSDKYRGFDKGTLHREGVLEAWEKGTSFKATLTRFVGLGSALARTDFSIWRTWDRQEKKLDVTPAGKRIPGKVKDYQNRLCLTRAAPNITPEIMSRQYVLAWEEKVGYDDPKDDGIPVRILTDEYEDSFH
jgi:hypothetical protein